MPERERNAGRSLVASVDGHQAYSPRVNVVPSSLTVDVEMLALSASLNAPIERTSTTEQRYGVFRM